MKKLTMAAVLATMIVTCSGISFAGMFDALTGSPATGESKGLSKALFDNYFGLSKKADDLQQGSLDKLSKMLLNKDDSEKFDRRNKEINAIKDPKEQESAKAKFLEDSQAAIAKVDESKATETKLKSLSADQKKLVGASISNLLLSALVNKSAVDVATGIVQKSQANPASAISFANDLSKIKEAVATLPGKIEMTTSLGNKLVKLASTNKIEVAIPKTATQEPQDVPM